MEKSEGFIIAEGGVDNTDLRNRRPITITPITYIIFMHILKDRVYRIAEEKGLIGEWQCGFRRGYRLDDNIFVLNQIVELSRRFGMGCIVVF